MFMCRVLLHNNTAVRDRSVPNVDWRGGVHCSKFCSVFLHCGVRGLVILQGGGNILNQPMQPLIVCISWHVQELGHFI